MYDEFYIDYEAIKSDLERILNSNKEIETSDIVKICKSEDSHFSPIFNGAPYDEPFVVYSDENELKNFLEQRVIADFLYKDKDIREKLANILDNEVKNKQFDKEDLENNIALLKGDNIGADFSAKQKLEEIVKDFYRQGFGDSIINFVKENVQDFDTILGNQIEEYIANIKGTVFNPKNPSYVSLKTLEDNIEKGKKVSFIFNTKKPLHWVNITFWKTGDKAYKYTYMDSSSGNYKNKVTHHFELFIKSLYGNDISIEEEKRSNILKQKDGSICGILAIINGMFEAEGIVLDSPYEVPEFKEDHPQAGIIRAIVAMKYRGWINNDEFLYLLINMKYNGEYILPIRDHNKLYKHYKSRSRNVDNLNIILEKLNSASISLVPLIESIKKHDDFNKFIEETRNIDIDNKSKEEPNGQNIEDNNLDNSCLFDIKKVAKDNMLSDQEIKLFCEKFNIHFPNTFVPLIFNATPSSSDNSVVDLLTDKKVFTEDVYGYASLKEALDKGERVSIIFHIGESKETGHWININFWKDNNGEYQFKFLDSLLRSKKDAVIKIFKDFVLSIEAGKAIKYKNSKFVELIAKRVGTGKYSVTTGDELLEEKIEEKVIKQKDHLETVYNALKRQEEEKTYEENGVIKQNDGTFCGVASVINGVFASLGINLSEGYTVTNPYIARQAFAFFLKNWIDAKEFLYLIHKGYQLDTQGYNINDERFKLNDNRKKILDEMLDKSTERFGTKSLSDYISGNHKDIKGLRSLMWKYDNRALKSSINKLEKTKLGDTEKKVVKQKQDISLLQKALILTAVVLLSIIALAASSAALYFLAAPAIVTSIVPIAVFFSALGAGVSIYTNYTNKVPPVITESENKEIKKEGAVSDKSLSENKKKNPIRAKDDLYIERQKTSQENKTIELRDDLWVEKIVQEEKQAQIGNNKDEWLKTIKK